MCADSEREQPQPDAMTPDRSVGPARVLLVDDQPARLLTYEVMLADLDVQCVRAQSGKEALEQLLRQPFAVIILDVSMPDMDGFETAHLIRAHPRFQSTPIIFVTGVNVSQPDALKGYQLGAIDYISVPVVPAILRSKVGWLAQMYRRQIELEQFNAVLQTSRAAHEQERRRFLTASQAQLRQSEHRYRAIFEMPSQFTAVAEPIRDDQDAIVDWRCCDANANLAALLQRPRDRLIGSRLTEVLPDRASRLVPLWAQMLRQGTLHTYETQYGGLDFLIHLFPMDGNAIVCSGIDITARIAAERELREADRRKDEFIATLAHELRNPLVPIRMGIELLKRGNKDALAIERLQSMMERQVGHMTRLIDDLLDISRITSGKIELRRRWVTLAALVNGAVESTRESIQSNNLTLEMDIPDPEVSIEVDPTRITQVISNLLQNAAKFTAPGGKICLRAMVEGEASGRNQQAVICVSDTGKGIEPGMLERVFELFAQADHGVGTAQSGLGIGLAIASKLIQLHGGTIEARSAGLGQGSDFIVRLPVTTAPKVVGTQVRAQEGGLAGLRVLVVDDNQDGADITALLLRDEQAEVRTAYSGAAALEILRDFRAHTVLLDIGMSGMDGLEACRRIRALYGDAVRLIAVSGWGQEQDKARAMQAGFDLHLTKPVEPATLQRSIKALWSDMPP
jgi:signal transduction histidine kinase